MNSDVSNRSRGCGSQSRAPTNGPRVCDPQQPCQTERVGMNSGGANSTRCCGSQSRAPDRESVTRSSVARQSAWTILRCFEPPRCCGSQSRAPQNLLGLRRIREILMELEACASERFTLKFGNWDFFGAWSLVLGTSLVLGAWCLVLLSGCAVGPNYTRPS